MATKEHPHHVVSSCLVGIPCRYDGNCRTIPELVEMVASGKAIALCPESLAGLPSPLTSAEITSDGSVMTSEGIDLTSIFLHGVELALRIMDTYGHQFEEAHLQARSPTCGIDLIYDGTFSGRLTPGDGVFAHALRERGLRMHCV